MKIKTIKDCLKIKALIIEPKKDVRFENISLDLNDDSKETIVWDISSVCNSERRRYQLTKSHKDRDSFIGGHEAIGFIEDEKYIKRKYALLPHSNCFTRGDVEFCIACNSGKENLCKKMKHAGLDQNTPSGFTQKMLVERSQLFDVTELDRELAPFLEPLSCVIRSWSITKTDVETGGKKIIIIGGGPIGCLHAFYVNKKNNSNQIYIIEAVRERREILRNIFKEYNNIHIEDNSYNVYGDVSVMAASDSSAFSEAFRLLKEEGILILFSGFNVNSFQEQNFLPEIIHRNEFTHFYKNRLLVGSSGYTVKDLILSKVNLMNFDNLKRIITGKVVGLDSKKVLRYDGTTEHYKESVLILDIKGKLNNHIKLHYYNNGDLNL